ncbi:helix-turn-helix domain-containing protein [Streptomyces lydicus]|uniref:helix-turn-helix domain-containing protein n=1 Tax=Streptomyces lydicus TaxID=47763 RepID=UPI0036FB043F
MVELHFEEGDMARQVLAGQLRRLREASGKSLAQLAGETNYDRTYLNRLENGERLSKLSVMEALDAIYGTGGLLAELWKLAQRDAFKDKYQAFMQREATAAVTHKYSLGIPGLLQTEAYARALMSSAPMPPSAEVLDEWVAARLGRQSVLRRDPPLSVRFIIDESALRRPAADRGVWREQLSHLVTASEQRNITIQVLLLAAGDHDLVGGHLSLLWMPDGSSVAYLEGSKSGGLVEDPDKVTRYRVSYERLRDMALSPPDSASFIAQLVEESSP